MTKKLSVFVSIVLLCGSLSFAQTFTETFDSGNEGNWTWGNPQTNIAPTGGNPGAYLSTGQFLDTFAPRLRTQATTSVFLGDYRANNVTNVGVDLIQLLSTSTTAGRSCTLMLIHDNGTPGDTLDDTAAYFLGPNIPAFGDGWVSYDYAIPSASTTLPPDWLLLNLGDSGAPPLDDWDTVIQNVNRVQFFYGDPTFFYIFQQWELGADNIRITGDTGPTCGDNQVDPPETCDPPGSMAGGNGNDCRDDCTVCGDSEVNGPPGAEQCDDGNGTNGDGCENDCTFTPGTAVPTVGEWGLIILALMLLTTGTIIFGLRRAAISGVGGSAAISANPPLFVPALLAGTGAAVLALTALGLALAYAVTGELKTVDLVGSLLAAPLIAYLVHLWLIKRDD